MRKQVERIFISQKNLRAHKKGSNFSNGALLLYLGYDAFQQLS